jgi:hypothetical protein
MAPIFFHFAFKHTLESAENEKTLITVGLESCCILYEPEHSTRSPYAGLILVSWGRWPMALS